MASPKAKALEEELLREEEEEDIDNPRAAARLQRKIAGAKATRKVEIEHGVSRVRRVVAYKGLPSGIKCPCGSTVFRHFAA